MSTPKRCILLFAGLAAAALAAWWGVPKLLRGPVPQGAPTPAPEGEAWIDLLDQEHRPAWDNTADNADIFEFTSAGELHIHGKTIYPLRYVGYTSRDFGDFDLHIEFKVARRANSGIFLRSQPDDPVHRGFEIQVLDSHGKPPHKHGCGAIYDVTTPMYNMALPAGEWNSYDISVHGGEVRVVMNGWTIIHTNLDLMTMPIGKYEAPFAELPRRGYLMIQDHGGEAWYRNIRIRPADEPPPAPAESPA